MSLISEALRKARRSEAEQEARQRGRLYRSTIPLARQEHRAGSRLLLGAALGIAAGLCAALGLWLVLGDDGDSLEPRPASTGHGAAEPMQHESRGTSSRGADRTPFEQPHGEDRTTSPAPTPEPPPPPHATEAESSHGPQGVSAGATETGSASVPAVATERAPARDSAERPPRSEPPEATQPVPPQKAVDAERTFVLDADLGHVTLSLGFIVFRPVDPFAEINGAEVRKGSSIGGFTVERIEADRVFLRDADGPLVLRVP